MGQNSTIEWTHHTFNPWWGCLKVSPGCQHCYAETMSTRYGHNVWGPAKTTERRTFGDKHWAEPLKWNKAAQAAGERHRVFCASMADVFEDHPALIKERGRLWNLIAQTPWLDWLLLTKRPERANYEAPWGSEAYPWPVNVWLGTSVENQEEADRRIPELLKVPAAVRFLSCEPLLGPVDLTQIAPYELKTAWRHMDALAGGYWERHKRDSEWIRTADGPAIHWVIVGGESGAQARPMHPAWARSLRDQCQAAGVAFHFKQWGEHVGGIGDPRMYISLQNDKEMAGGRTTHAWGEGYVSERVGKKAAGRTLDGRTWDEFPEAN